MRISDWSSDVCSSDLFVGRWSMKGHLVGSDEVTVKGETRFRWLPGDFFLEQSARLNFLGLEIESQIGRASCRERVCQYVSISGVAVSLKTTQNQITT